LILTIAIPHSHDIVGLKSTLECLKDQQHKNVEILVNDNASGQKFRDIMSDMSHKLGNLVSYENTKFQTYDQNVDKCVQLSNGNFVWLLGVGDTIPQGHIGIAIELIRKYPKALNILAEVNINKEERLTKSEVQKRVSLPIRYQNSLGTFPLDSVYNSALSGNLVNRHSWLVAAKGKLEFENWVHVERTLQMYANGGKAGFGIRSHELSVVVERPKQGWWNQDDMTFVYNSLIHAQILNSYGSLPALKIYKKAELLKNLNLSLIKAYWYGKTVKNKAPVALRRKVNNSVRVYPIVQLAFTLFDLVPSQLLSFIYLVARRIKSLFR